MNEVIILDVSSSDSSVKLRVSMWICVSASIQETFYVAYSVYENGNSMFGAMTSPWLTIWNLVVSLGKLTAATAEAETFFVIHDQVVYYYYFVCELGVEDS